MRMEEDSEDTLGFLLCLLLCNLNFDSVLFKLQ